MLSRACSGVRGQTLILSVPGSERAAVENLRAILPALPAVEMAAFGTSDGS
jgi:gephyrin